MMMASSFLLRNQLLKTLLLLQSFGELMTLAAGRSSLAIRPIQSSAFMQLGELVTRDNTECPSSNYISCGSEVPSTFCCPKDSNCMVLASNTTAVCCPKGSCNLIEPIVCDLGYQNVSAFPKAPIHTTALDASLLRCGTQCCPFGYRCDSKNQCVLDEDQADYKSLVSVPLSTPTSSSATVLETSTSPTAQTSTTPTPTEGAVHESPSTVADTPSGKRDNAGPTGLVTALTVAGACSVTGVGIFIWTRWCRKSHGQAFAPQDSRRDSGWGSWKCPSATGSTPLLPQHLSRRDDGKSIDTPREFEFRQPELPPQRQDTSPVELPATPVSFCMWSNLENAAVEEPQLAYVIPAKRDQTRRKSVTK